MIVKSIGVLSLGKILGSIYAGLGLIFGVIIAGLALLGLGPGEAATPPALGFVLGGGAVIALPLFYGLMGFVGGLVVGTIYNFVARFVGGLRLELE